MKTAEATCAGPSDEPGRNCDRDVVANGLCQSHDMQERRGIKPLRPLRKPHGRMYPDGSIRVTVSLSRKREKTLRSQAKQKGFSTLSAYLATLLDSPT